MNAASFLATIRESPADDVPRLIYADWLEDQGDYDRAEFIRVQCELTRGVRDRGRSVELLRRLRDLIQNHRREWLGPLKTVVPDAIFERGFIDHIRVRAGAFLKCAEAIFRLHPIRSVRLEGVRPVLPDLVDCEQLNCLHTLDLQLEPLRDLGLGLLGGSPHLRELRALDLSFTECTASGIRDLVAGGRFGNLESLKLSSAPHRAQLENDCISALRGPPGLPSLRLLDLSGNRITQHGAEELADSAVFRNLRQLNLSGNPIGMHGIELLAGSPHLQNLELLDVRGFGGTREDAVDLIRRFGARVVA